MAISRDARARLHGLCGEKGFELRQLPGGALSLIRLDIGHAVMNGGRRCVAFSAVEAIAYLKAVDVEAE